MWLVYPVTADDIRDTRRGIVALLAGSAVWYLALAAVLAVWGGTVLEKVENKFTFVEYKQTYWPPILALLVAWVLAGGLRLVGYRLCRNVAGAVGAADGLFLALIGGGVWVAAFGTLYFGFSGLLAVVAALGTVLELKFVRFPVQLFGMVVSQKSVARLSWYFVARSAWLVAVLVASLVILAAHILIGLPRVDDGPIDQSVRRVNAVLRVVFDVLAVPAVVTLPLITVGYWVMLLAVYRTADRLTDPNGPVVDPQPPERAGYDLLKQVLQNQDW